MLVGTRMTPDALYRLMAWLSPAFPVGAYSHSHGLEWAVESGAVTNAASAGDWIEQALRLGGGRNDAILFAHGWRCASDVEHLTALIELALAGATTLERRTETLAQGRACLIALRASWPCAALDSLPLDTPYPIVQAVAAAGHNVPRAPALTAYLQAWGANLVSAAVRLVPLGQSDGQRIVAALAPAVAEVAGEAERADLDALGGSALMAEIASMCHETQYTRLFRT